LEPEASRSAVERAMEGDVLTHAEPLPTRPTARIFDVPISLVTLIDDNRLHDGRVQFARERRPPNRVRSWLCAGELARRDQTTWRSVARSGHSRATRPPDIRENADSQ